MAGWGVGDDLHEGKDRAQSQAFANFKKANLTSMHATGLVGLAYAMMQNAGKKSAQ